MRNAACRTDLVPGRSGQAFAHTNVTQAVCRLVGVELFVVLNCDMFAEVATGVSTARVLRNKSLGAVFDSANFDPAVFPPVFVVSTVRDCKLTMREALLLGGKTNELLQEVAFANFFKSYPLRATNAHCAEEHTRHRILTFIPLCIYTEHAGRPRADHKDNISILEAKAAMEHPELQRVVGKLHLHGVDSRRCFYPVPYMLLHPTWKSPLRLCRGLVLDRDWAGASRLGPWDKLDPPTSLPR